MDNKHAAVDLGYTYQCYAETSAAAGMAKAGKLALREVVSVLCWCHEDSFSAE